MQRGLAWKGVCVDKGGEGTHAGKIAAEVGGMHPNGMHSYLLNLKGCETSDSIALFVVNLGVLSL